MCNLTSLRKGPPAILDLARAMWNDAGNLEPRDHYPDDAAPIARMEARERILTTDPSEPVKSVHLKAMPVILTDSDDLEAWMTAPWEDA